MTSALPAPPVPADARLRDALPAHQPRAPLSARRIAIVLARATGLFGLVFGLQSLPVMIAQLPELKEPWGLLVAAGAFGGILIVAVASFIDRWTRITNAAFAIAYVVVVVAWPLIVADPTAFMATTPWIWYLCTVATANAVMAFRLPVAIAYTVIVPVCYGVLRLTPAGGHVGFGRAGLDTIYAIILGSAVLIILVSLQQAAEAVDASQAGALEKYAAAVRQHATEVERVQVDALVHDSVLTTLLSAAAAETTEQKRLAARMARTALDHLATGAEPVLSDEPDVPLEQLAVRIRSGAAAFAAPFVIRTEHLTGTSLPAQPAEAITAAAVQAMVNSMRHAGGSPGTVVRRSLTLTGTADGCRLVVADSGQGFDLAAIPQERLGIRVSIVERMHSVGGSAEIDSTPGEGTTITLVWPDAAAVDGDPGA